MNDKRIYMHGIRVSRQERNIEVALIAKQIWEQEQAEKKAKAAEVKVVPARTLKGDLRRFWRKIFGNA